MFYFHLKFWSQIPFIQKLKLYYYYYFLFSCLAKVFYVNNLAWLCARKFKHCQKSGQTDWKNECARDWTQCLLFSLAEIICGLPLPSLFNQTQGYKLEVAYQPHLVASWRKAGKTTTKIKIKKAPCQTRCVTSFSPGTLIKRISMRILVRSS